MRKRAFRRSADFPGPRSLLSPEASAKWDGEAGSRRPLHPTVQPSGDRTCALSILPQSLGNLALSLGWMSVRETPFALFASSLRVKALSTSSLEEGSATLEESRCMDWRRMGGDPADGKPREAGRSAIIGFPRLQPFPILITWFR